MGQVAAFKVIGLDCAEEIAALKAEIAPLRGIRNLEFDVLHGKLTVEFDESAITEEAIIAAVAKTGMQAERWQASSPAASTSTDRRGSGRAMTTAASGGLLALGIIGDATYRGWQAALLEQDASGMPMISRGCFVLAAIAGAWYVLPKAGWAIRRLRPDMNLLMVIAIGGALAIGQFVEAATVAFLFAVSLVLESWSVSRARRAIVALLSLSPDEARVLGSNNQESMVPIKDVPVGAQIVVHPSERFPLDGTIAKGETTVDQSPITGESVAVAKAKEDEVFAGTINLEGAVEVVVSRPATQTTLANIIRMVGDAQSKRSNSEQWVERFARLYTPAVMGLAVLVIVTPPLVFHGTWTRWIYEGLVLLVIACPCALVISTPVSIVAAMTAAARRGVLVKGGQYMEAPASLKAIALDKTGTITKGEPEVRDVIPWSGYTENDILEIAAALEQRAEHPLAKAIVRRAAAQNIRPAAAEGLTTIPGKGVTAVVQGKSTWAGSHRLLEERGQETDELHQRLVALEAGGASVVVIATNDQVCGVITLADQIRPQARAAIDQLRATGIGRCIMLTGDNRGTADAIGHEAGVDEVRAELLPQDKVTAVEELVRQHGQVAMVGDGINDAPALARATLGIAMGAIGTDAALETADVVLMSDDLLGVVWLIEHSQRTLRIIRQNIFLSLGVKVLFVLLTLLDRASLWAAIAADTGVSLAVIFNALRLLRKRT